MDTNLLAYLAGALDSDGYFTIKRDTYGVRVRGDHRGATYTERVGLKQVSFQIPELLQATFGGHLGIQKPSAKNGRSLHTWLVANRQAAFVAEAVLPYLRIKVRQAMLILDLRELKDRPRDEVVVVTQKDRWGQERPVRKKVLSHAARAARQSLFEQIKQLNDTRATQPKLG